MSAPTVEPHRWAEFIRREYLEGFIREGGSAIKFVVPLDDASHAEAISGARRCAAAAGYVAASVSAADTRVDKIDHIFFRIAEQVPWQTLSQETLTRLAIEEDFRPASTGPGEYIARLCEANGLEAALLRQALRPRLQQQVFRDGRFARDFRVAATQLCLAELSGGDDGEARTEAITNWLTGRNRAIAAVKPYQIFTRIQRTNARHLIASLLRWVRFAGHPGTLIDIDLSRVTMPANPRDGLAYYTKAAMFDAYEVTRQFIDATDELKGLLVLVTCAPAFLDDAPSGRGLAAYGALMARVFDEIRDARLVNPMAALTRLRQENLA